MSRPGSLPLQPRAKPVYEVTSKARLQVWGLRVGWKPVEETGQRTACRKMEETPRCWLTFTVRWTRCGIAHYRYLYRAVAVARNVRDQMRRLTLSVWSYFMGWGESEWSTSLHLPLLPDLGCSVSHSPPWTDPSHHQPRRILSS